MSWFGDRGRFGNFGKSPWSKRSMYYGKTKRRRGYRSNLAISTGLVASRRGRNIVLRPELKFKDTTWSAVNVVVGSSAVFTSLPLMAQGTSGSTRLGNSINIKSCQLSLSFHMGQNAASTLNANLVRVCVLIDTQANDASPAETAVFELADNVNSFRTIGQVHRFKMLLDRKLVFNAPGLAWNGSSPETSSSMHKTLKYYKKMNLRIAYEGNVGDVTDVTQNNLLVFIYADGAVPLVKVTGVARIRYTDL